MIPPVTVAALLFTQLSCSSVADEQLQLSAEAASLPRGQNEFWMCQSSCNGTSSLLCGCSAGPVVLRVPAPLYQMVVAQSLRGGTMCHPVLSCPV